MATPSFADRDGWIWMNGELVPWRDAKVHVLTHTLHYGLGVFEGVRAYATHRGATIFRLHDHTQRLLDSAHILGMKIPYSKDELNAAQCQVVKANGLDEGYLRPMCFLGSEADGASRRRSVGERQHRRVAVAVVHGSRGARSRHQGQDVVVHPASRQHHDVQGESERQLHQFAAGVARSARLRRRRSAAARRRGLRGRRQRRERVRGSRRRTAHAGTDVVPERRHAAHVDGARRRDWA